MKRVILSTFLAAVLINILLSVGLVKFYLIPSRFYRLTSFHRTLDQRSDENYSRPNDNYDIKKDHKLFVTEVFDSPVKSAITRTWTNKFTVLNIRSNHSYTISVHDNTTWTEEATQEVATSAQLHTNTPEPYSPSTLNFGEEYGFQKHAKYRLGVLESALVKINKTDNCFRVYSDPLSFWRSQPDPTTNFTAEKDLARLLEANRCSWITVADFIRTPPRPTLYDFEQDYLSDPPFTDISRATNESTSSVVLLNSSSTFHIGDILTLFITMRDSNGQAKLKGGDEVRVWLTQTYNHRSVLPASITDLNNGSYLARVVLDLIGTFSVTASLVYSREYIQTLLVTHLMIKSTTVYLGAFRNLQANETTVCSHVPVIPGVNQSEICNVTEVNGSPWFCGRPVKRSLECTDYVHTRMLPSVMTMPMNEAEHWLMYRENKYVKPD